MFRRRNAKRSEMAQYIMKGGNPLVGEVSISGAKNAALGILAASVMADEDVLIENLPDVQDINMMLDAIREIGADVTRLDTHTVRINGKGIRELSVESENMTRIRASYYLIGALLGKYGRADVPMPGGCEIGQRPIDQHLKGFRALGAEVEIVNGRIRVESKKLRGEHIFFDVVSVGATINVMMAAALSEGRTILENAAKEPHIVDVANFLNSMGANIKGAGTDVIRIVGVPRFHAATYSIIPDQIEAGTFMFAAAITRGDIMVKNLIPKHMEAISAKLIEMGCEVLEFDDAIRVVGTSRLRPVNVKTLPYPGFPTDMQPQVGTAMALARGVSVLTESIFESRYRYLRELSAMGACSKVEGNTAIITGVEKFSGAEIHACDLRAGAALVLAGLAAEGITTISDIHFIQRGYEHFEEKLCALGAVIKLANNERDIQKFMLAAG